MNMFGNPVVSLALLGGAIGIANGELTIASEMMGTVSVAVENREELLVREATQQIEQALPGADFRLVHFVAPDSLEQDFFMSVPSLDGTGSLEIVFCKSSVRGDNFHAYYQYGDGILSEFDPGPVRTMRAYDKLTGELLGTGLLTDNGVEALVNTPNGLISITPASTMLNAPMRDIHVITRPQPQKADRENGIRICGMGSPALNADKQSDAEPTTDHTRGSTTIPGAGEYIIKLTCRADESYTGSTSNIEGVVNSMTQYDWTTRISYMITSLVVEVDDPYIASSPQAIIDHFIANAMTTFEDDPYDAGLFFTDSTAPLPGGGTALGFSNNGNGSGGVDPAFCVYTSYIGIDVPSKAYSYVVHGSSVSMTYLAQHEFGHLWGMEHVTSGCNAFDNNPDPIMCSDPDLLANDSFFDTGNVAIAATALDQVTCLDRVMASVGCRIDQHSWGDPSDGNKDLNSNFVLDTCEIADRYRYDYSTNAMLPFNGDLAKSVFFTPLPMATGDVTLTLIGKGDFSGSGNTVSLFINPDDVETDTPFYTFFNGSDGKSCTQVSQQSYTVSKDMFNAALAMSTDQRDVFHFIASDDVDACSGNDQSYIRLQLTYNTRDRDVNDDDILDEYEVVVMGEPDCNGNRVPDSYEMENDRNGNGVPDICEVGTGMFTDCNSNGVIDSTELIGQDPQPTVLQTPELSAPDPDDDEVLEWLFEFAPLAAGDTVRIEVQSNARLDDDDEYYELLLNGVSFGYFFDYDMGPTPCQTSANIWRQSIQVDRDDFNDLVSISGSELIVSLIPMNADPCSFSFSKVSIIYDTVLNLDGDEAGETDTQIDSCQIEDTPSLDQNYNGLLDSEEYDCNGNGTPDDLDPDSDGNGIPDDCEIAGYVYSTSSVRVSPLDYNVEHTIEFTGLPPASSDIVVAVTARGKLHSGNSSSDVDLVFGGPGTTPFTAIAFDGANGSYCDEISNDVLTTTNSGFSVEDFNAAIDAYGNLSISIEPGVDIRAIKDRQGHASECSSVTDATFLEIQISYNTIPEPDCDMDTIPDNYEIAQEPALDMDDDGVLDACVPFEPNPSVPGDLALILGTLQPGSALSDAVNSDDEYAEVRVETYDSQSYVGLQARGISANPTDPNSYTVSFELHPQNMSGTIYYGIRAYRWDASPTDSAGYKMILNDQISPPYSGDLTLSATITSEVQDFIRDSDGMVIARIFLYAPPHQVGGLTVYPVFDIDFDNVQWIVK